MTSDTARAARHLLRLSLKGSLGTLDVATGAPYVSMVSIATGFDGSPLMLLSGLARHTVNLMADPRASLLVDSTDARGDPNTGARLTISGRVEASQDPSVRVRYLARHPDADQYADFGDFGFWRLEIASGHAIGGFGRIQRLTRDDLCLDVAHATDLAAGEPTLVAEFGSRSGHAAPLVHNFFAARPSALQNAARVPWQVTGVDPEGLDLAAGSIAARLNFDSPVTTLDAARGALARLATATRNPQDGSPGQG